MDKILKRILENEKNENWNEVMKILKKEWINDKNNLEFIIMLGFECWYILSEYNNIDNKNLDYDSIKNTLIETTDYGLVHFNDDIIFLSIYGYMISLFPFLFYKNNDDNLYLSWEDKANSMISKAYDMNKNNELINIIYYGNNINYNNDFQKKQKKSAILVIDNVLFRKGTLINKYFSDIINTIIYSNNKDI